MLKMPLILWIVLISSLLISCSGEVIAPPASPQKVTSAVPSEVSTGCAEPPPKGAQWVRADDRCLAVATPFAIYRLSRRALVKVELVADDASVFVKDYRSAEKRWSKADWTDGHSANLIPGAPEDRWLDRFQNTNGLLIEGAFVAPVPPIGDVVGLPKGARLSDVEHAATLRNATEHVLNHINEDGGRWTGACPHRALFALGASVLRDGF